MHSASGPSEASMPFVTSHRVDFQKNRISHVLTVSRHVGKHWQYEFNKREVIVRGGGGWVDGGGGLQKARKVRAVCG